MRTHGHRKGSTKHWGLLGGKGEGQWGEELGRDSMGRNARCGCRGGRQQITLPRVYLCNYLACYAHVPQNLKGNFKKSLCALGLDQLNEVGGFSLPGCVSLRPQSSIRPILPLYLLPGKMQKAGFLRDPWAMPF